MIALNEIIKNKELFLNRYKLKGRRISLKKLFNLESKNKELQLKTESMRSNCNKLCGIIAELRNKNQDTSSLIFEINKLDMQIKKNNKLLARTNNQINKILSKLHNLPDDENLTNLQLETKNKATNLENLESFLNKVSTIKISDTTTNKYLYKLHDVILDSLPQVIKCNDGYVILSNLNNFETLKEQLLNYFKLNAEHLIKVSIKKISKECASSYLVHLNKTLSLNVDIIREYNTRSHKIKYHDTTTDMTKFVNQINIKIRQY